MPAEVEDHNDSYNKLKISKKPSVEDLDKDDDE